jgi:DNA-binding transcriptional ArsR family regulator
MTADNVHSVRRHSGHSGGRSGPSGTVTATLDAIRADRELSPASRRFADKLVRAFWWKGPARRRVSIAAMAGRLDVHRATVSRHLTVLVDAGYLTAEGRQGGRAGRKGRGIVPVWSLSTVAKTVSTVAKTAVLPSQNARVEKPERIAAYAQVRADTVRVSTVAKCDAITRETLTGLSLDSKPAFGGDDWTAPADVPARVADLRAAARPRSRLSA